MPSDYHKPVLLDEVIEGLNIKEDSIVVDMTLGRAGHSSSLLARCKKGHLYATDKDQLSITLLKNLVKFPLISHCSKVTIPLFLIS